MHFDNHALESIRPILERMEFSSATWNLIKMYWLTVARVRSHFSLSSMFIIISIKLNETIHLL